LFLSGSSSVTSLPNACFLTVALHLQANTYDELPEQLLGAARLSHIEPSAAVYPDLENISWAGQINLCRFFHSFPQRPKRSQFVQPLQHFAVWYSEVQTDCSSPQVPCTSPSYSFDFFLGLFFITLLV
jgi:hypothetical protein